MRSCYSTDFLFPTTGGFKTVRIRWYFTDQAAFKGESVYGSLNWGEYNPFGVTIGEVAGALRVWKNGAPPPPQGLQIPQGAPPAWNGIYAPGDPEYHVVGYSLVAGGRLLDGQGLFPTVGRGGRLLDGQGLFLVAGQGGRLLDGQGVIPLVGSGGRLLDGQGVFSWEVGSDMPTGEIIAFGASSPPTGYLLCDGAAVSRTTFSALFAVIGTTWGAGNGSTTFNVPDMRSRSPIGMGTGSGLSARALAAGGGTEAEVLTLAMIPAHTHTAVQAGGLGILFANVAGGSMGTLPTSTSGGGGGHPNMHPWRAVNFCIKT